MIELFFPKNSSKRLRALATDSIVFLNEIPFSNLLLDSVLIPSSFEDFLIVTGLKTAPF